MEFLALFAILGLWFALQAWILPAAGVPTAGVPKAGSPPIFFVRDNGMGIDRRYHRKIFGLFERLETGEEGTGIGLAVAKRIVELRGGRIWVESEGEGRGSTFCFTLGQESGASAPRRANSHG